MKPDIAIGNWPTMLTPFTLSGSIDYPALERMIEWYIAGGVNGLFAVCQSSEMFYLALEERVELARFVVEKAAGRVPVIASGHISERMEDQLEEIRRIAATGIEAFVLVSNRLAAENEDDSVWRRNAEHLLESVPDIAFGIYECPFPYKRLLSPELLKWCADTGRFWFLKDTCCSIDQIRAKLAAVRGTKLKLFNANTATLLESLQLGAAGFSGIMANFHPELYTWLLKEWRNTPVQAGVMQGFLTMASYAELKLYPANAKYYMQLCGLPITTVCRSRGSEPLPELQQTEMLQLQAITSYIKACFGA
ncbi:dihydrodipicolinate synthase family protein [Paenibacillus humicola]|uniref:dihydrodipicolinate synthase family protein n=1 Tax=Paenibacillus humicola TaxID=3110540 RepID=UPI00237C22D1|nr:dihydrodipicolinate synthase family protein [Paenibacillus humicola]